MWIWTLVSLGMAVCVFCFRGLQGLVDTGGFGPFPTEPTRWNGVLGASLLTSCCDRKPLLWACWSALGVDASGLESLGLWRRFTVSDSFRLNSGSSRLRLGGAGAGQLGGGVSGGGALVSGGGVSGAGRAGDGVLGSGPSGAVVLGAWGRFLGAGPPGGMLLWAGPFGGVPLGAGPAGGGMLILGRCLMVRFPSSAKGRWFPELLDVLLLARSSVAPSVPPPRALLGSASILSPPALRSPPRPSAGTTLE